MEPDIVDRLRHEDSMNPERDEYKHEVLGRAAAELTRLRAELDEASRHAKALAKDLTWFARMVKASHAADSDVGRALKWAKELKP